MFSSQSESTALGPGNSSWWPTRVSRGALSRIGLPALPHIQSSMPAGVGIYFVSCPTSFHLPRGTWCSGITSAPHAEGPGFKSQCVHVQKPARMWRPLVPVVANAHWPNIEFLHIEAIHGPVAQWIRHRPTEPGIAGSSPARVIFIRNWNPRKKNAPR